MDTKYGTGQFFISPRLLFLSGCRTGEMAGEGAAVSFAHHLVEQYQYHVPAVVEAVQRARYDLLTSFAMTRFPAWYLLRLFSSGVSLDALVQEGQKAKPKPRNMVHRFLRRSRVQVLAEGFVGRRRQLQQCIGTLKQENDKVGVLLLGTGGLGKSCLAGKLSERFAAHTLAIVHGSLNAVTLENALKDAFIAAGDDRGEAILEAEAEMEKKLAKLCASCFKERNYLLLLDDFEQNLVGAEKGRPGELLPEAGPLVRVLLDYLLFSGNMSHVMITCRCGFALDHGAVDLVKERLEWVWLAGFQEAEQRKKARELQNFLNYEDESLVPGLLAAGRGNPRLMEWLDVLVGEMEGAEVPQLFCWRPLRISRKRTLKWSGH